MSEMNENKELQGPEAAVTVSPEKKDPDNETKKAEDKKGQEKKLPKGTAEITRFDLEKFASSMRQQKNFLLPMKRVLDAYKKATAEGKIKEVDVSTIEKFLTIQLRAIDNSIGLGKELEKIYPAEDKKAALIVSKKAEEKEAASDTSKKEESKTTKETNGSVKEDSSMKLTKKQVEKAGKKEQFISLFDF